MVRITPTGETLADPPQTRDDPIRLQALSSEQVARISYYKVTGNLDTGRADLMWDHSRYYCATPGGAGTVFDAQWSPDGRRLAVIGADCWANHSYAWGYAWNNALFLIDTANPQRLPERIPLNHDHLSALAWSPDGAWLVVAQDTEQVHFGPGMHPDGLWLIN
ncbi:hypothetical protein CJ255_22320, partial [Candidatus Viridilinea mediisalina]